MGLYDAGGKLDYIVFCSAFANAERRELLARLEPLAGGSGFTGGAPGETPARWNRDPERDRSYIALRPELVLEVGFDQVTGGRCGTVCVRCGGAPIRRRKAAPSISRSSPVPSWTCSTPKNVEPNAA